MIGDVSRETAAKMLGELVVDHWDRIKEAYIKSDDALSIAFFLTFSEKGGKVLVSAGINFVESRLKEKVEAEIVENQLKMNF